MLRTFGIAAVVSLMALGTLSITEAASSDNNLNDLCCRGSYCYNQNYNENGQNNSYNCGEYCERERGCGCW